MRCTILGWLLLVFCAFATSSVAASCGGTYTVKQGDTLMVIAGELYRDRNMWSAIHAANKAVIGEDPNNLRIGMRLSIDCIDGAPRGLDAGVGETRKQLSTVQLAQTGTEATERRIDVLTGSDFPPFVGRDLPGGGLLTEVVQAAMEAAAPEGGFAIHWVDDRSAHRDPLLSNALLDIGFPWSRPDCDAEPEMEGCAELLYSSPMFESLTLLFVDTTRPLAFRSDADLKGKRLCIPKGHPTHIFEAQGRNWLGKGHVTLRTVAAPAECLQLLVAGEVDGAVLNEFLGHILIRQLGLQDRVSRAEGQPISIEGAHMIAHRSHPAGPAFLAVFEEGLARIRSDGTFQRIVDAHMTRFWAEF